MTKDESSILVVGSIAFDSISTPAGEVDRVLGGSLNYFSIAASIHAPVRIVGVVGQDFPKDHVQWLNGRGIDTSGLEFTDGKTFYWKGVYDTNLSDAKTLKTELNVFETFQPRLNEAQKNSPFIFLANIDPALQLSVLEQNTGHQLVAMDSMNFWLEGQKLEETKKVLKQVDILSINEGEACMLSGERDLKQAAYVIRKMGPKALVIKRGEIGAALFTENSVFLAPAYLVNQVKDPTGAGDTFAAGFMSYLAKNGITRTIAEADSKRWDQELRKATVSGCVMASFTVEDFGINRIKQLEPQEFNARHKEFLGILSVPE